MRSDSRYPGPAVATAASIAIGTALPAGAGIVAHMLLPDQPWQAVSLHSAGEALGAGAALLLASLLFLTQRADDSGVLLRVAPAFVCLGVIDLFHACAAPGNAFVWLHAMASISSSALFALVWLGAPRRRSAALQCLALGAVVVAFGAVSLAAPDLAPVMVGPTGFTKAARALHATSGVLYWVGAAGLLRSYARRRSVPALVFATVCLLLGTAGVLFPVSEMWEVDWWYWHALRLAAYGVTIAYTAALWLTLQRNLDRAFEEIRTLNAGLEHRVAERTADLTAVNNELETFAYSASHDLRTPLRAIAGFSHAIREDHGADLGEDGRSQLDRIAAAAKRMGQLIDALLGLSRVTRAPLCVQPVDLAALARPILDDLRAADPSRRVEVLLDPELPARGDPHLLGAVLQNLLENAWKFSSKREDAGIEIGSTRDADGQTIYFVSDNGAGFDMAYADKLFGTFQRLHATSEFPGTGIGLATVRRVLDRHGGRVWLESRIDEGTTVRFTLWTEPAVPPPSLHPPPTELRTTLSQGSSPP